jgi:hypothetical protein
MRLQVGNLDYYPVKLKAAWLRRGAEPLWGTKLYCSYIYLEV